MRSPEDVLADPGASEIDRQTAELYLRIVHSGRCCQLPASDSTAAANADPRRPLLVVVPGAFHREHRHTGADGARVLQLAREMGADGEVIPLGSFSPIALNAQRLLGFLRERQERRVVLVSLSKGSADVKAALRRAPEAFAHVRAWVNLSGLPSGTPLVACLKQRRLRWLGVRAILWWYGHRIATLEELTDAPDGPHAGWPVLPAHLRAIHVAGFPLREQLQHPWAARAHERLASRGPNDGGGLLLSSLLDAPGEILPIWAADHYLQPNWDISSVLRRLFRAAIDQTSTSTATASAEPASRSTA